MLNFVALGLIGNRSQMEKDIIHANELDTKITYTEHFSIRVTFLRTMKSNFPTLRHQTFFHCFDAGISSYRTCLFSFHFLIFIIRFMWDDWEFIFIFFRICLILHHLTRKTFSPNNLRSISRKVFLPVLEIRYGVEERGRAKIC